MKIGFLTSEYPHAYTGNSGGIGTSIKNLATALADLGHEVSILVYNQQNDGTFFDDSLHIHQIKNVKWKGLSWYLTRKKIERYINSLVDAKRIELIEAADWTGITSFIQPKCPVIIKLHGSDTYFCHLDKRPVKWINKFHEKRALKKADGHLSVSAYTAQVTNQLFGLHTRFSVIHNGVDIEKFKPATPSFSTKKTILYFGTLIRKKGVLELPYIFNEVVKEMDDVELVLVGKDSSDIVTGNGSTWQMMQSLFSIRALEKITFVGAVAYEKIASYIEEATVCVFPSFAEAFPVSWLEAMAKGKAIVASDIGWAKEVIIDGQDGFLVNPISHKEFSDKIVALLNDENLRQSFAEQAVHKIKMEFERSIIAKQNSDYYQSIVQK